MATIDYADITATDKFIATLLECKPLPEAEVHTLAERVTFLYH